MTDQCDTSWTGTFSRGSDETSISATCDLCITDGQHALATGHCVSCKKNVCDSCIKLHKKIAAIRYHDILIQPTMSHSQEANVATDVSAEELGQSTVRCPNHPKQLIDFYCNSHSTLGCWVCIEMRHGICKNVSHITDISKNVAYSDEMVTVQDDLNTVVAKLNSTKSRVNWIKQAVNDSISETVSDIRKLKREIIGRLDQMENDILERAVSMAEKEIRSLDGELSSCECMMEEVELIIADFKNKMSKSDRNGLFIAMKHAQSRVRTIVDEASRVSNDSKCERLSFNPDTQLTDIMSPIVTMGTVAFVSNSPNMGAKYQYDINIKSGIDLEECLVMGVTVLSDHRLALVDHCNASLKIVDTTKHQLSEQIPLVSNPIDLTVAKGSNIAVTLKGKRFIEVLSTYPALSYYYSIPVPGMYGGIEYIPDKFILLCYEPIKGVHICDMSGALLQQVETDFGVSRLLTMSSRIAISPDYSVVYITEYEEETMVSMTIDGKLISKYSNDKLKHQQGLAIDTDGYVYVCSVDKHQIHQLSFDGQMVKIILTNKDGIKLPLAIAQNANNLYISSKHPKDVNKIKVYRLSERQFRAD